jgi:hypothetical protein
MPETFDTTYLFDHMLLLSKVEEGRAQLKEGKGQSTDEVRKKLQKSR